MEEFRRVSYLVVLGFATLLLSGAPGASGQTLAMEPVFENNSDAVSEVVSPVPDVETEAAKEGIADGSPTPDVESEQGKENITDAASDGATAIPDDDSANSTARQKEKFFHFWANRNTVTKFVLSVFNSVTPYTCASTRNDMPCMGRRRRFFRSKTNIGELMEPEPTPIDSSLDLPQEERSQKTAFLTVWTTSFSTKTVTSYMSNTRVTVSVSQACTIAGMNFAQCG